MPVVTLATNGGNVAFPSQPVGGPAGTHCVVARRGGGDQVLGQLIVAATDPAADLGDFADEWVEIPRPGKTPLLRRKAARLQRRTLSMKLFGSLGQPVEDQIARLRKLVQGDTAQVYVEWGPSESAFWRATGCAVKSVYREQDSNAITYATVELTVTEVSDGFATVVPGQAPQGNTNVAAPRSYTVQQGDTLFTVSQQFYGTPTRWRDIGDANSIINPQQQLTPGSTLKLP